MNISIPVSNIDPKKLGSVRIFFTNIHGLLAIIIPGIFIYLIDGGHHKHIYPNFYISNQEKLKFQNKRNQIHIDEITRLYCQISGNTNSHLLIDGNNGIIYDFQIDRLWIVNQFSNIFMKDHDTIQEGNENYWKSNEELIYAIHLAMFHIGDGDDELFLQIISMIFLGSREYSNHSIDKEIVKEILICFVYNEVRKIKSYEILLSIIPITSIFPFHIQCNHSNVYIEKSLRSNSINNSIPRLSIHIDHVNNENLNNINEKNKILGSFSSHIPPSAKLMHNAIIKHLEIYYNMDVKQAHKYATAYCFLLVSYAFFLTFFISFNDFFLKMNTVEVIFRDYIMKGRNKNETVDQFFQILLNFYSALEELSFPIVGSFNNEFITVGFEHLPRRFGNFLCIFIVKILITKNKDYFLNILN